MLLAVLTLAIVCAPFFLRLDVYKPLTLLVHRTWGKRDFPYCCFRFLTAQRRIRMVFKLAGVSCLSAIHRTAVSPPPAKARLHDSCIMSHE
jgi:hypothetical protein